MKNPPVLTKQTPGILNPEEFRYFKIQWDNGAKKLWLVDYKSQILFEYTDPNYQIPRYLGWSTGIGAGGGILEICNKGKSNGIPDNYDDGKVKCVGSKHRVYDGSGSATDSGEKCSSSGKTWNLLQRTQGDYTFGIQKITGKTKFDLRIVEFLW